MLISQILVTFESIRRFPGLTLEELADKMRESQPGSVVINFLIFDNDYSLLKERINSLNCIDIRENRYYFNENKLPYSSDELINSFLKHHMATKVENKS